MGDVGTKVRDVLKRHGAVDTVIARHLNNHKRKIYYKYMCWSANGSGNQVKRRKVLSYLSVQALIDMGETTSDVTFMHKQRPTLFS